MVVYYINMNNDLQIDDDSFGIIVDFLKDDLQFLLFLKQNNIKPKGKEIIWKNLNWNNISKEELSIDFIREFRQHLDWDIITNQFLNSEDYLREFQDNIIWDDVSARMKFTNNYEYDFYEEFKDKLDWHRISRCGNMDEYFIIQFENELDWDIISTVQGLTEYLIHRFSNKINWNNFRNNNHIPQELRDIVVDEYDNNDEEVIFNNDIEIDIVPLEQINENEEINADEDDDIQMVD